MRSLSLPLFLTLLAAPVAGAQAPAAYPNKPIRVVVAQQAGGTADTVMRMYAEKLGETFGQRLVVDNRAGSGVAGLAALQLVAQSNPDGYTLLLVVPSFTFTPALVKHMPVDAIKDFAPVTLLNRDPYLVTVSPDLPAATVKDLVAHAKSRPGTLNAGAGNFGSGTHLVTVYFLSAIGIKDESTYIPYKSMGGAFIDAMAGRLHVAVSSIVSAWPHVKTGRLRALAVTSARRSDSLPDVPTVAEEGASGFEASAWNGLVAPAKTPPAVVRKLSDAAAHAAKHPDIRDKLKAAGSQSIGSTPGEFRVLIETEIPRWRSLVTKMNIAVK